MLAPDEGTEAGIAEVPPVTIDLRYTNGLAVLWPKNLDAVVGTYGEES